MLSSDCEARSGKDESLLRVLARADWSDFSQSLISRTLPKKFIFSIQPVLEKMSLKINKDFAGKYDSYRRKEELQKMKG